MRKRFVSHGTPAHNASVAAQLINHTTKVARGAGVDFVCLDSSQQIGSSFGERLSGAMRQVFAQGYEQLLVIGNDCPQLDECLLQRAVAALRKTGAVLGPATDGGVYLLGVSRLVFERANWTVLPWQTNRLGAALLHQLRLQHTTVQLLPPLTDVDNEQDLAQVLRQSLKPALRRTLRRLRARPRGLSSFGADDARLAPCVVARPHRGPPAC